ncbi:MAG: hypothetical protein IJC17_02465 [Clostridia bacterium]|nr:hypothetical protein [Clostridia bacterium]
MLTVKLADLPIRIDNLYPYTEQLCRDYRTDEEPVITVAVTPEEIAAEDDGRGFSAGYLESVAVYRKICAAVLPYNAFLLHAAVIAVDGEAYAFSADSGIGKTTHLKLWRRKFGDRCQVLNGDKPLLRIVDGNVYAYGTPWSGKEGWHTNAKAPLKALCFLERSEKNHIARISDGDTLPLLFSQLMMPTAEEELRLWLDSLDRLIRIVPCYRLGCNMDLEAADVAYNGMK